MLLLTGCGSVAPSPDQSSQSLGISNSTLSRYSLQFIPLPTPGGTSVDDAQSIARRIYPHLVVKRGSYGRLIDSGTEVLPSGWVISVDPASAELSQATEWCLIAVDPQSRQVVDLVGGSLIEP
ncbi:MAG: hypothetical protein ABSB75_06460 [Candidatus Limnocylindrales bacterium]